MSNGTPPPPPPAGAPPSPPPQGASPPSPGSSGAAGGSAQGTGFPLWAKIGLGCGCLVLIAGLAIFALLGYGAKKAVDIAKDFENNPSKAVETLIELNPELDVVKNDSDAGTITVRNTRTGEEATFDYSDVKNGNFKFESDEGSYSLNADEESGLTINTPEGETRIGGDLKDVPAWVPRYPNAEATEQGGMTIVQNDRAQGMAGARTTDTLETVEAWFQEKLEGDGYTVERSSINAGGAQQIILQGKKEGIDQMAVTLSRQSGATHTQIAVAYSGPKDM